MITRIHHYLLCAQLNSKLYINSFFFKVISVSCFLSIAPSVSADNKGLILWNFSSSNNQTKSKRSMLAQQWRIPKEEILGSSRETLLRSAQYDFPKAVSSN